MRVLHTTLYAYTPKGDWVYKRKEKFQFCFCNAALF